MLTNTDSRDHHRQYFYEDVMRTIPDLAYYYNINNSELADAYNAVQEYRKLYYAMSTNVDTYFETRISSLEDYIITALARHCIFIKSGIRMAGDTAGIFDELHERVKLLSNKLV